MAAINTQFWLEEVSNNCAHTLASLNNKAQRKKEITDGDQVMSEICMGYLYLLHKANEEGILESGESIGELINIKIH